MLKQINHKSRALFLKLFTQELIDSSKPKKPFAEKAEKPVKATEPVKTEKKEEFIPSILAQTEGEKIELPELATHLTPKLPVRPSLISRQIPPPKVPSPQALPLSPLQPRTPKIKTAPPRTPSKIEGEIDLGKINPFLTDKAVTLIECPGPNKFIFVKKAGQVNLTKTALSQEEIEAIIENFSEKSRIPVIGGIFKASVGNLTITAVVSEFVGSKFIIYKASPYSVLEKQTQQLQQAQLQAQAQRRKLF